MIDRILFTAPRLHPNQFKLVEYLIGANVQVKFGVINKCDYLPLCKFTILLPPSFLQLILNFFIVNRSSTFFIPRVSEVFSLISDFRPEIIIVRDRSIFSLFVSIVGRLHGIKVILYNQTAIISDVRVGINKRLWRTLFPRNVMSPVLYRNDLNLQKKQGLHTLYEDLFVFVTIDC